MAVTKNKIHCSLKWYLLKYGLHMLLILKLWMENMKTAEISGLDLLKWPDWFNYLYFILTQK